MSWWMIVWAIGAVAIIAFYAMVLDCQRHQGERTSARKVGGVIALAVLWPLPAAVIAASMAFDFACWLAAVARKPH